MKILIKTEEATMTLAALFLLSYHSLALPVWLWCILFFAPDISMLGYLINTRYGAWLYNFFHHKALALAIVTIGYSIANETLIAGGLLLFAHACFDRIWGYGLKYETGFKDTHLGSLAKQPKGAITLPSAA
jgi:hypothetical protein